MSAEPPGPELVVQALPVLVTVGFAGHRSVKATDKIEAALAQAFSTIQADVLAMASAHLGSSPWRVADAYGRASELRLLTGDAPGADRLAIGRWREAALGEVHVLFPFRDPLTGQALTDDPDDAKPEDRIADPPPYDHWTGLDGRGLGLQGGAGHSEQARWIVRHSDLLVTVWNGKAAAGAGGSGETVLRALERGLLVIWIEPGDEPPRLINPNALPRHVTPAMAMEDPGGYAQPLEPDSLTSALSGLFAPPGIYVKAEPGKRHRADPEIVAREDYVAVDPLMRTGLDRFLDQTAWRTFAYFKKAAGGLKDWTGPIPPADFPPPPADLDAQPGFHTLDAAFRQADERANQLGAIHRSQQLLLSSIAVVAVLIGSLPALATGAEAIHRAHLLAAVLELLLAGLTAILTGNAARAHRHRRWSDARRLAERLRAACATWPIGVDLMDVALARPQTWTEWRARAVLRAAGPPQGWFGRREMVDRGGWAASQLIASQINYHAREHHAGTHIAEVLNFLKESAFGLLTAALAIYLAFSAAAYLRHEELPAIVGGIVSVVGAVSPSVAAAALALESTNGFEELALRSKHLREKFEELNRELDSADETLNLHQVQEVLRTAALLLVEDADSWRDRAVRRKIATTA